MLMYDSTAQECDATGMSSEQKPVTKKLIAQLVFNSTFFATSYLAILFPNFYMPYIQLLYGDLCRMAGVLLFQKERRQ
jgi:hypothetical protein